MESSIASCMYCNLSYHVSVFYKKMIGLICEHICTCPASHALEKDSS